MRYYQLDKCEVDKVTKETDQKDKEKRLLEQPSQSMTENEKDEKDEKNEKDGWLQYYEKNEAAVDDKIVTWIVRICFFFPTVGGVLIVIAWTFRFYQFVLPVLGLLVISYDMSRRSRSKIYQLYQFFSPIIRKIYQFCSPFLLVLIDILIMIIYIRFSWELIEPLFY